MVRYLALGLLNTGKPFSRIGNWFWKKHRDVFNWNKLGKSDANNKRSK